MESDAGRRSRSDESERPLPEIVSEYVRELIVSGEVRFGEFLRIDALAASLGMSDSPVRKGLLLLRNEGLVELVPRRGFKVAEFTRGDIYDLFWIEAALAGELAERAARNMSDGQLGRLATLVAEHSRAVRTWVEADMGELSGLGREFHMAINAAAESRRLITLLPVFGTSVTARLYTDTCCCSEEAMRFHRKILRAMEGRDCELAGRMMREHIMSNAAGLIAVLDNNGVWADGDKLAV